MERTQINTAVAVASIEGNFAYANEVSDSLLADQLELFRRGQHGEGARPIDDELALSLALSGTVTAGGVTQDVDNAETFSDQEYPDAYVIPLGRGQRSDTAAARLAQILIDNDVEVLRAWRPFQLHGTTYGAGSFVVDMYQAKRGLANTILDTGRDVSENFPTMYDISAWSHGELWGATVERLEEADLPAHALRPAAAAEPTGSVAPGRRAHYGLEARSVADIQAVHALLDRGVELGRSDTGTFVVPGTARSTVLDIADEYGVEFTSLPAAEAGTATPFEAVRLGTAASFDDVFSLARMGFDTTSVTHTGFNTGAYTFDDFDAFYVSTTAFNPLNLNATQQAAFADWLEAGGTVVGRGASGVTFNNRTTLFDVAIAPATPTQRENGIVAVVNDPDSPITGSALTSAFVFGPRVFTSVGEDVRVDQRLEEEDFVLAGHWITGRAAAAGQPVVVSGTARGANVTLFATEPLFRTHPEGKYQQVAEALWQSEG